MLRASFCACPLGLIVRCKTVNRNNRGILMFPPVPKNHDAPCATVVALGSRFD